MSLIDSIRSGVLVPVNKEGYPFIGIAGAATLGLMWLNSWTFWPMLAILVWVIYFFRDPERVTPVRDGLVIAPADGRVSLITQAVPPPELELGSAPMTRISIFMNVFNCHVNRAPVPGQIRKMVYRPGLFLNADLDKASDDNERNSLVIHSPMGDVGVVQIAGLVARRIVWWVQEGQSLGVGERFGMIRFGSRVDVYLPEGLKPLVGEGQLSIAGETVLADSSSKENQRTFRVG